MYIIFIWCTKWFLDKFFRLCVEQRVCNINVIHFILFYFYNLHRFWFIHNKYTFSQTQLSTFLNYVNNTLSFVWEMRLNCFKRWFRGNWIIINAYLRLFNIHWIEHTNILLFVPVRAYALQRVQMKEQQEQTAKCMSWNHKSNQK